MSDSSSSNERDQLSECFKLFKKIVGHILPKGKYTEGEEDGIANQFVELTYGAALHSVLGELRRRCDKDEPSRLKLIKIANWLSDHLLPEKEVLILVSDDVRFSRPKADRKMIDGAPISPLSLLRVLWVSVGKDSRSIGLPLNKMVQKSVSELTRSLDSIDRLSEAEVIQSLELGAMFEPLPLYIAAAACRIAKGQFTKDDIQPGDMRPDWIDEKGKFHVEWLFEDVVYDLFVNWVSVYEQAERWSGRAGPNPDGVLAGAGLNSSSVLYDAKQSKNPCDLRNHETQIRDHVRQWGNILSVGHYLLVAERFTEASRTRAPNLNLTRPDQNPVCMSLWEVEALLYLGELCHPRIAGPQKIRFIRSFREKHHGYVGRSTRRPGSRRPFV